MWEVKNRTDQTIESFPVKFYIFEVKNYKWIFAKLGKIGKKLDENKGTRCAMSRNWTVD